MHEFKIKISKNIYTMFTKTRLNHFEGFSSNSCGLINLIRNKNLIIIPSFTLLNTAVSTFVIKYILKVPVRISNLRLKVIYPQGTKEGAQSKYLTGRAQQKKASREGGMGGGGGGGGGESRTGFPSEIIALRPPG